MNNASILVASLIILAFGIILWRQSNRDKSISHRKAVGILLVIIGGTVVIYQLVNIVMFILNA